MAPPSRTHAREFVGNEKRSQRNAATVLLSFNYTARARERTTVFGLVDEVDVVGAIALFRGGRLVLDVLTNFGGSESIHHELSVMEEIILSILAGDESVALLFVELLDSTLHCLNPFFATVRFPMRQQYSTKSIFYHSKIDVSGYHLKKASLGETFRIEKERAKIEVIQLNHSEELHDSDPKQSATMFSV